MPIVPILPNTSTVPYDTGYWALGEPAGGDHGGATYGGYYGEVNWSDFSTWDAFHVVILLLEVLVVVVGLFGNGAVIIVYCIFRRLRTPVGILLLYLAILDFAALVMLVPWIIARQVNGPWPFPDALCGTLGYLAWLLPIINFYAFALIGAMRYFTIFHPRARSRFRTNRPIVLALIAVTVLGALMALPVAFSYNIQEVNYTFYQVVYTIRLCDSAHARLLHYISFFLGYCIPFFLLMLFSVFSIKFYKKNRDVFGNSDLTETQFDCVILVAMTVACFPWYIVNFIWVERTFTVDEFYTDSSVITLYRVTLLCDLLATSLTAIDPYIFNLPWKAFRGAFVSLLCCRCHKHTFYGETGTTDDQVFEDKLHETELVERNSKLPRQIYLVDNEPQ